jgi:hypothetical protein
MVGNSGFVGDHLRHSNVFNNLASFATIYATNLGGSRAPFGSGSLRKRIWSL